jgi:hypothetical protein
MALSRGCSGFAVWERKNGPGRNVTFPARAYSVNGEAQLRALRPVGSDNAAQNAIRELRSGLFEFRVAGSGRQLTRGETPPVVVLAETASGNRA